MVAAFSLALTVALTNSRSSDIKYDVVQLAQIDHSTKNRPYLTLCDEGFMMRPDGQVCGHYFQGGSWHTLVWDKVHGASFLNLPQGVYLALFQTPTGAVFVKIDKGLAHLAHAPTVILYRLNNTLHWDEFQTTDTFDDVCSVNSAGAIAVEQDGVPLHQVLTRSDESSYGTNKVIVPRVLRVNGPTGSSTYPPGGVHLCDDGVLLSVSPSSYWPKGPWKNQSGKTILVPSIEGATAKRFTACSGSEIVVGLTGGGTGEGSFLWMGDKVTYFPPPGAGGKTLALGVNKDATIVGQIWKSSKDFYGYIQKRDGEQVDANTLLSPEDTKVWKIEALEGISDDGLLLGAARKADNGNKLYEIVLVPDA